MTAIITAAMAQNKPLLDGERRGRMIADNQDHFHAGLPGDGNGIAHFRTQRIDESRQSQYYNGNSAMVFC